MSRKRRKEPPQMQKRSAVFLSDPDSYDVLCVSEYTSLDKNPEVLTACRKIADMVSSMTIHLMANTENGDQRIINELSRKVDINPNQYMTRKTWMDAIVMNLILHGKGNSIVIPMTTDGGSMLGDMVPIAPHRVGFRQDGYGYKVMIDGKEADPSELLHFVYNPDPTYPWKGMGITTTIRDVAYNLRQAAETEKGFMQSKFKPSVIVKVDGLIEQFADKAGRKKLMEEYLETSEAGEPWIIPAEQFAVDQIRPLSLSDLAINDSVQLNKRTVAAILGVPAFVLGVGSFDEKEWNNFINSTIRPLAKGIEQELTRKLLISPKWYWKFNVESLYSYDISSIASVYSNLYTHGIVTGNEVRDRMSMSPKEGLDQLVILENFIPTERIGDQNKLGGGENE